ncbi:hypothetical protein DMENIID0001_094060 [Sergentomyia squamirostris]
MLFHLLIWIFAYTGPCNFMKRSFNVRIVYFSWLGEDVGILIWLVDVGPPLAAPSSPPEIAYIPPPSIWTSSRELHRMPVYQ